MNGHIGESRRLWTHHRGDRYMPVFGDFWGNPEQGYRHEWSRLGDLNLHETRAQAQSAGFKAQGSDDFNIAVCREGRVVACLWMHEVIDQEQSTLDDLTSVIFCGYARQEE